MGRRSHGLALEMLTSIATAIIVGIATKLLTDNLGLTLLIGLVAFIAMVPFVITMRYYRLVRRLGKVKIYRTFAQAERDIVDSCFKSRHIDIMVIRGRHVFGGRDAPFDRMCEKWPARQPRIRVLWLDPSSRGMDIYLSETVSTGDRKRYLIEFESVVNGVVARQTQGLAVNLAYYRSMPTWKLVITDHHCFFVGYSDDRRGHSLPMLRVETSSNCLAVALRRYYEDTFEGAHDVARAADS